MSQTSWPYVDQPTSDEEYSALFENFTDNGVVGISSDTKLRPYGDSSGMNVKVPSGDAFIRGYYFRNTDNVTTLPIEPSTGSARVDRVVLRLNVAEPNATDRIQLDVLKGVTPGVPLALTQNRSGIWEESLGLVTVRANTPNIAAADLADDRNFIGHVVGWWASDLRRPDNPDAFQIGFNSQRGYLEVYVSGDWRSLPSDWAALANKPAAFPPAAHSHTWDSITGKPTSYPPSAHKHVTGDITNFQGYLNVQSFAANTGYATGAVIGSGRNVTMQSVVVTVPAGKTAVVEAFGKVFIYTAGGAPWAASMRLEIDGTTVDAFRFHSHGHGGPTFPTGNFIFDLKEGRHTIALIWDTESASTSMEFWDTDNHVAVLWPS